MDFTRAMIEMNKLTNKSWTVKQNYNTAMLTSGEEMMLSLSESSSSEKKR